MKIILPALALFALTGAAVAQEAPPPAPPADPAAPATPATPPTATDPAMPAEPATPATPPTAAATAMPAAPAMPMTPSKPEKDARGIAVVSTPGVAPDGANAPVQVPAGGKVVASPSQASVFTPKAAEGDVPACSKTVTDRCKQTYERKR